MIREHFLLLLLALPSWIALRQGPTPLNLLDGVAAGLFVLLLIGETVADQQQWNFHRRKAAPGWSGPAFLAEGLFRLDGSLQRTNRIRALIQAAD